MVGRPWQEAKGNRSQKAEVKNENWLGQTILFPPRFSPYIVGCSVSLPIRKPGDAPKHLKIWHGRGAMQQIPLLPLRCRGAALRAGQCVCTTNSQVAPGWDKTPNARGIVRLCGLTSSVCYLVLHRALVIRPAAGFQWRGLNPRRSLEPCHDNVI